MRRFRFWLWYLRSWPVLLIVPLARYVLATSVAGSFDGIRIVDMEGSGGKESHFLTDMIAALRLIKSVDPRRFRRIEREIDFIVNEELMSFGNYQRAFRKCGVDYGRLKNNDHSEWYVWKLALMVVHEATHGSLYSRGIEYTPALRLRIEHLCRKEEKRFATKADREDRRWSDALAPPLNEKWYRERWLMPRWERAKFYLDKIRKCFRTAR